MNELAGQNLGGYRLEEEVGRGAMGVVYRGKQLVLGREVAIKVLPQTLARDSSYVARFTREAKIMANLNHPNIVQIYDAGRQNKHLYFVMEFIQGPTLANLLYLDGIIPQHLAIEYAIQIAEALNAAYSERNVIHRDIKPENLMLNRWGKIKVMDFGLARAPGLQTITVAQTLVGSIYYASPEQIWGLPLDNRSDIYALGVVLYEMVCGRRPFNGRSMHELTQAIINGHLEPPSTFNPAIAPELEHIIMTALARDREQRYIDAESMAQELRALAYTSMMYNGSYRQVTGGFNLSQNRMQSMPGISATTGEAPVPGIPRHQFTQPPRRPQARGPITLDTDNVEQPQRRALTDHPTNKHNASPGEQRIAAQPTVEMPSVPNPGQPERHEEQSAQDTSELSQKSPQGRPLWGQFQKKMFKPTTH
jgi:serine/threonine-protein kinase